MNNYLKTRKQFLHYREDLLSLGNEVIVTACKNFDPTKGARFDTYLTLKLNGKIKDFIRAILRRDIPLTPISNTDENIMVDMSPDYDLEESGELFDRLERFLSEDEMTIVNLNLTGALTNRETADELGIKYESFRKRKATVKKKIERLIESGELYNYES